MRSKISPFRMPFFLMLLCLCSCSPIKVNKMTCNYEENALAASDAPLRFSWQLSSNKQACMQSAYQLEVYDSRNNRVWETSPVQSNQSQLVLYDGPALQAAQKYYWRLRVWNEKGKKSAWKESSFRLAPEADWLDAKWIGAITRSDCRLPEGRHYEGNIVNRDQAMKEAWKNTHPLSKKSIYLRKDFSTEKQVVEATAYVVGLGHYELSLNGKKVGDSEFAPLWSDYDKTIYYNVYDVTKSIKRNNAVGVLLGNGFFNEQGGRYRKLLLSFGPPTLFFKLHLVYADGSQEDIRSDASWKYDFSPLTFNSLYGGEDYDANLEQDGWNTFGFDDSAWHPVVLQEAPKGELQAQWAPAVKVMRQYSVQDYWYKKVPADKKFPETMAYIMDMGQNLAGFPEITLKGKAGDKVRIWVGESLGKDSVISQNQSGKPHYYDYTLKGAKSETYRPRFAYYGFRYIRVEGAVMKGEENPDNLPVILDIKSCFVHNSVENYGRFESSNEIFNNTHELIQMAIRSNMQAFFTDCPHREKLGWLEQDHLNGPGILYNYDMTRFWPKILQDMSDSQTAEGMVPSTSPTFVEFPSLWSDCPEWGSAAVILPFMYYHYYGDDSMIRKHYPMMKAYVDYLEKNSDHHIVMQGLGDWYDFGPNRPGFAQNTPVPLSGTAHHYQNIQLLVRAAKMLGYQEDVDKYTALGEAVNAAFHKKYFRADSCIYGTGSQSSYAMPLYMDMVAPENRDKAIEHLLADIESRGFRLSTGEVGNRYMFQFLAQNGFNDYMYKMHNHEEVPGYGFQKKFGATTLTEQWDPRQGASWNHFMLGAIDEWFFRTLGGIQIDEQRPGGKYLIIRPEVLGDMTFVKCATQTLYGQVAVDWEIKDDTFVLKVEIPANSEAKIYMPGQEKPQYEVKAGKYTFKCKI
ncbi:MAG: family 78 glycoside hydrolase catalytic domain [Bacteroidales bacterium]|nr:family 78 glycoside hydrolase catalytic domain [Bacteroidales bacterium]